MTEPARTESTRLDELARLARTATNGDVDASENARGRERLIAAVDRHATHRSLASRRWLWITAAAAMLAVVAVVFSMRRSEDLRFTVDGADGAPRYVSAGPNGALVAFSEGTTVRFSPSARGRIAEVTAHGARVDLEDGAASFKVVHLPRAAWIAEAGPYTIEVTGTEFDVSWASEKLEVDLHQGSVIVRGPRATGGVALHAGERLVADVARNELRIASATSPREAAESPRTGTGGGTVATPPAAPATTSATAHPADSAQRPASWRARVASGDFAGVLADAEARGFDASIDASSLSDLGALADAARYAGKSDIARRALTAERTRFPDSAEAKSAAFLLGRMVETASPAAAITWYDRYLAESPNGPLAGEALGRKMLGVKAVSGVAAAKPIAEEVARRFPDGAYATAAREILASP